MDKTNQNEKVAPWVPVSKDAIRQLLPKNRSYTEAEALLSLQLDHNDRRDVSVMGYSKLWGWTRKKTIYFFERADLEVVYPQDTKKVQNQLGNLRQKCGENVGTDKGTDQGQIKFIDFNKLQDKKARQGTDQGTLLREREKEKRKHIEDPKGRIFKKWWMDKYQTKFKRGYMVTNFGQFGAQMKKLLSLPLSFEDLQYVAIEFLLDEDPFIIGGNGKNGTGHNIGMLLIRINQNAYSKYLDPGFREKNKHNIVGEEG